MSNLGSAHSVRSPEIVFALIHIWGLGDRVFSLFVHDVVRN